MKKKKPIFEQVGKTRLFSNMRIYICIWNKVEILWAAFWQWYSRKINKCFFLSCRIRKINKEKGMGTETCFVMSRRIAGMIPLALFEPSKKKKLKLVKEIRWPKWSHPTTETASRDISVSTSRTKPFQFRRAFASWWRLGLVVVPGPTKIERESRSSTWSSVGEWRKNYYVMY